MKFKPRSCNIPDKCPYYSKVFRRKHRIIVLAGKCWVFYKVWKIVKPSIKWLPEEKQLLAVARVYAEKIRKQMFTARRYCPMLCLALKYYLDKLEEKYGDKLSVKVKAEVRRMRGLLKYWAKKPWIKVVKIGPWIIPVEE